MASVSPGLPPVDPGGNPGPVRGVGPSPSPPKEYCFLVRLPADTPVNFLLTGLIAVAGPGQVDSVQHRGGALFMCAVKSRTALNKILEQHGVKVKDQLVTVELLGPRTVSVACYMLPPFVRDADLECALRKYGRIHSIVALKYRNLGESGNIRTGTRIVNMEMDVNDPVPNYIRVQGYLVTCEYPGVKRVCRRCKLEGHIRATCMAEFCNRCSKFGHPSTECSSRCKRCKGNHATAQCTKPRSFASAVSSHSPDFPELPPPEHPVYAPLLEEDTEMSFVNVPPQREGSSDPEVKPISDEGEDGCEQLSDSGSDQGCAASEPISSVDHASPAEIIPGRPVAKDRSTAFHSSSDTDTPTATNTQEVFGHPLPQHLAASAFLATQRKSSVQRAKAPATPSVSPFTLHDDLLLSDSSAESPMDNVVTAAASQPVSAVGTDGMEWSKSDVKRALSSSSGQEASTTVKHRSVKKSKLVDHTASDNDSAG